MLSQAVLAAYTKSEKDGIHHGQLTISRISSCPYATYINYRHLDDELSDSIQNLRMKNGKWQELECLEDLRKAGFKMRFTGSSQMTVHVGKSRIAGRPDGLIWVDSREDVLSIKARSLDSYTKIRQKGVDAEPATKCQEQLYLASEELKDKVGTWLYVKHKDSCRPYDLFIARDDKYSQPIVEAVDMIVLGNEEIKRPDQAVEGCSNCKHRRFCWKNDLVNMSGIKLLTKPEVVGLWLQGQFHLDLGKQYNEEARVLLKEFLSDNDILFIEGKDTLLEVKRIIQHRSGISENKFIEKFGAAALVDVIEEKEIEQMRVIPRF